MFELWGAKADEAVGSRVRMLATSVMGAVVVGVVLSSTWVGLVVVAVRWCSP